MANQPQPPRGAQPPRQDAKPKLTLPVIDDSADRPIRSSGHVKVVSFDDIDLKTPAAEPPRAAGAADPGVPVNHSSRAVNPRKQYPLHFDLLMRDLYQRGDIPEHWQIIAAEEIRLDETNMDVEFTVVDNRTNAVVRRCVQVQAGKLLRISER
jgi:hypothetical protein